jgi:hypothetical protein
MLVRQYGVQGSSLGIEGSILKFQWFLFTWVLNIIWFNVSYPSFNKLFDDGSTECVLYTVIKDKDTYNI